MQQLTCPNCGEIAKSENINIQQMVAVCHMCDHVFQFDAPSQKVKRRKVKKPIHMLLDDTQGLKMAFRTNFRLSQDEGFQASAIMSLVFTFLTLLVGGELLVEGGVPILIPLAFGIAALAMLYNLGRIVYNRTHIDVVDDEIVVTRKPLLDGLSPTQRIQLSGIEKFTCEETAVSKRESYDLPRYGVWAEYVDGTRKIVVNDVTDEYGYFIAQRLEEYLNTESNYDSSRLIDDFHADEVDPIMQDALLESEQRK